jgi:hypothetical protein
MISIPFYPNSTKRPTKSKLVQAVGLLAVRESEGSPASPRRVASTEVSGLINSVKLLDILGIDVNNLEVGCKERESADARQTWGRGLNMKRILTLNASRGDRLGEDVDARSVSLKGDQDVGRGGLVLVRNLLHNLILKQRRVVRAKGRVGGDDNALLLAEVNDVSLRARAVKGESDG